jgi:hypothetical protein
MEGSFADGANNHGLKRARWRGLKNQQTQDYLIAVCQNLRLLIRLGSAYPPVKAMRSRIDTTKGESFRLLKLPQPHSTVFADTEVAFGCFGVFSIVLMAKLLRSRALFLNKL